MDIVINELSLDGQFDYESFMKYLENDLIPILKIASEKKCLCIKNQTYIVIRLRLIELFMTL